MGRMGVRSSLYTIYRMVTVKFVRIVADIVFDESSIQERLDKVRAFTRDANCKYLLGLIESDMLLVRTATDLNTAKEAQARRLKSARNCEQRAQRSLWKVREQTDVFNQIAAELERLEFEIKALTASS